MRDKEYRNFCQRLSDDNFEWLAEKRKQFKSWNLLFNELKKSYGIYEKRLNRVRISKEDSRKDNQE